jgi:hypothetical protein
MTSAAANRDPLAHVWVKSAAKGKSEQGESRRRGYTLSLGKWRVRRPPISKAAILTDAPSSDT